MPDIVLDTVFNNPLLPKVQIPGFLDDFTRPDSLTLGATSREGRPWQTITTSQTPVRGTISGNKAVCGSGANATPEIVDGMASDGIITVTHSVVGTRQTGVVFRLIDKDNYCRISARASSTNFHWILHKVVNGSVIQVALSTTIESADGQNVSIEMNGTQITVLINGVAPFPTQTIPEMVDATKHGYYWGASVSGGAAWDLIHFEAA